MRLTIALAFAACADDGARGSVDVIADGRSEADAVAETVAVAETLADSAAEVEALVCDEPGDLDHDGLRDCEDDDDDFDGVDDVGDVCPRVSDPAQADADGDGLGDACDTPAVPVVTHTDPASPSGMNHVYVFGTGELGARVWLFRDEGCTLGAGNALVDATGHWEIQWHMQDDSSAEFHAYAINAATLQSDCSESGVLYVEDSTAPAAPELSGQGTGTAEPNATVRLHFDECLGEPVATGAADGQGAFEIAVAPHCGSVWADALDAAGNLSACSAPFQIPCE